MIQLLIRISPFDIGGDHTISLTWSILEPSLESEQYLDL
jgi:hypothetical protein